MTPQESDLITTLLARLKNTANQPKDPDAERLIRQAMVETPDAPYYMVQTVLIQDLSLRSAQDRIAQLEQQVAAAEAPKPATSFLGGLFGQRDAPPPAPMQGGGGPWARTPQVAPPPSGGYAAPQPGYAQPGPGYAPQGGQGYGQGGGMMGGGGGGGFGGGGFLRSAAATAAGVAGGALLFQGISSLFGHSYANSLGGGMGSPGLGETVTNNYYGDSSGASGGDYGGGGDSGYSGGGGDYGGGGDSGYSGGGDYGGGGDGGGGDDYGGGGDSSSC